MAWRIAVGFCIFGAGWFAVDLYMPDLLPRIDVAVITAVKHFTSALNSFAIEGKDTRDRGLKGSPQQETLCAAERQAAGKENKDSKDARDINVEESAVENAHNDDDTDGKDRGAVGTLEESRQSEDMRPSEQAHNHDDKDDKDGKDGTHRGEVSTLEERRQLDDLSTIEQAHNNDDKDGKDRGEVGTLEESRQSEDMSTVEQAHNDDEEDRDDRDYKDGKDRAEVSTLEESRQLEGLSTVEQVHNDDDKDDKDGKDRGEVGTLKESRPSEDLSTIEQAHNDDDKDDKNDKDGNDRGELGTLEESRQSEDLSTVEQAHNDDDKDDKDGKEGKDGKDRGQIGQQAKSHPEKKKAENNEEEDAKDTKDVGLDRSPQREIVSVVERADNGGIAGEPDAAVPGLSGKRVAHHGTVPFEKDDVTPVGEWKKMESVWYEKIMDRLIPEDLRIIFRATRRALERVEWPEWMADMDWDKACLLLLSSVLWVGFATWYFKCGTEDKKKEVDVSPENAARAMPAGCRSSFGIFEMARHALQGYRHEGGYIYSIGTDKLKREDAAAAIIQRWARTEFKRWLRNRALSRSSVETSPLDSHRWIDRDHGAFVPTTLEDPCLNVHALGPPETNPHSGTKVVKFRSDPKVAFEKCLSEIARRGGNHVDSSQDIRRRQKLSLSSTNISKVLLRLQSRADPHASQSPVSKPP